MDMMTWPALQRGLDFNKASGRRALARHVKEDMERVKAMLAEREANRGGKSCSKELSGSLRSLSRSRHR